MTEEGARTGVLRRGAVWAGALLLTLACGRGEPPPHVVIVSVDTLNRSALRAFNGEAPALPALDAFAAALGPSERAGR